MQPSPEMTNPWQSPFLFVVLGILCFAFLLLLASRRSRRKAQTALSEPARAEQDRGVPRCVCGEVATDPGPGLARSRSDILRSYFGAPPRYKRSVDLMQVPTYCRSHAHLADVLLDRFIYDLRAEQAATNASIAAKAANYEQEGLAKQIADSLTDDQKKASRRPSNVTRITGT